jgi:hypothetical protein
MKKIVSVSKEFLERVIKEVSDHDSKFKAWGSIAQKALNNPTKNYSGELHEFRENSSLSTDRDQSDKGLFIAHGLAPDHTLQFKCLGVNDGYEPVVFENHDGKKFIKLQKVQYEYSVKEEDVLNAYKEVCSAWKQAIELEFKGRIEFYIQPYHFGSEARLIFKFNLVDGDEVPLFIANVFAQPMMEKRMLMVKDEYDMEVTKVGDRTALVFRLKK